MTTTPTTAPDWRATARRNLARLTQTAESARLASNSAGDAVTAAGLAVLKAEQHLTELENYVSDSERTDDALTARQLDEARGDLDAARQVHAEAQALAAELSAKQGHAGTLARAAQKTFDTITGAARISDFVKG